YDQDEVRGAAARVPWPLGACFTGPLDLISTLAQRAQVGLLGDLADWTAAEVRWRTKGVFFDDLVAGNEEDWPYTKAIATAGAPVATFRVTPRSFSNGTQIAIQRLLAPPERAETPLMGGPVASWALLALGWAGDYPAAERVSLSADTLEELRNDTVG